MRCVVVVTDHAIIIVGAAVINDAVVAAASDYFSTELPKVAVKCSKCLGLPFQVDRYARRWTVR